MRSTWLIYCPGFAINGAVLASRDYCCMCCSDEIKRKIPVIDLNSRKTQVSNISVETIVWVRLYSQRDSTNENFVLHV